MREIDIFDFLQIKSVRRKYGTPEHFKKEIASMPVTLISDDGKDFVVYLLVKHYNTKTNSEITTISGSPYKEITVNDEEIVCERFDSDEPVRYDMSGKRLNEDSKLTLRELD